MNSADQNKYETAIHLAGCVNRPLWIVCSVYVQDPKLPGGGNDNDETKNGDGGKIGDGVLMQRFPSKIHNLQPLPEKLYCNPGCGLQGCEMEEQDEEEQEAAEELDELRASM